MREATERLLDMWRGLEEPRRYSLFEKAKPNPDPVLVPVDTPKYRAIVAPTSMRDVEDTVDLWMRSLDEDDAR